MMEKSGKWLATTAKMPHVRALFFNPASPSQFKELYCVMRGQFMPESRLERPTGPARAIYLRICETEVRTVACSLDVLVSPSVDYAQPRAGHAQAEHLRGLYIGTCRLRSTPARSPNRDGTFPSAAGIRRRWSVAWHLLLDIGL